MQDIEDTTEISTYLRVIVNKIIYLQDKRLVTYDITSQQARLLVAVEMLLKRDYHLCQKELGEIMQLKDSSITSLLKSLEKKNFILRKCDKEDGRRKEVQITEKGYGIIKEMKLSIKEMEDRIISTLSEDEIYLFRKILRQIYLSVCW